ncbi:MAG TPA: cytochrome c [Azospirillaceae bacterium]|nr:cytochrome c [Azospirillaceae bacterium]
MRVLRLVGGGRGVLALAVVAGSTVAATFAGAVAQPRAGSANAVAGDATAQVQHRQDNMKRLGDAAKAIGRYVKNEGGTAQDVQAAARTIREVSARIVPELFPTGTAEGVSDSKAKPEIWREWSRFQEDARALEQASAQLAQAAATGERTAIVQAFGAVGKACSSCHDDFRVPEKKT